MKRKLHFIFIVVLIISCKEDIPLRENVTDRISHIEDSIRTTIPHLPRLCDSLDLITLKVDIGDCKLHVEIEGRGIPLVLVNGGPGGTHHYFHPWFSRMKNEHKIIYYDQRGTGLSDFKKGDGYSFEQAVNDLEALRSKLDIDQWIVCGYSYGGGLAQFYTLKYPEHVQGMVLINSLPMLANHEFESEQEKYLSFDEKKKKEEIINNYINSEIPFKLFLYNLAINGDWKRQHFLRPTSNEMIRSALYEWINDQDFNDIMSTSYSTYNFENAFDQIPIPSIIFEGLEDLTWGKTKANIIRGNHPNAKFLQIDKAGHTLFMERPDVFFTILTNFTTNLDSIPSSRILKWKNSLYYKFKDY